MRLLMLGLDAAGKTSMSFLCSFNESHTDKHSKSNLVQTQAESIRDDNPNG
jgi:hypothetical protein